MRNNEVAHLSGGELQRFAIGIVAAQAADIYMIDEPSSYLDVRQRLKAAKVIRNLLDHDKYVIVVEHDLSVLDYLSDFICCLYGQPGAYGVVTLPFGVRQAAFEILLLTFGNHLAGRPCSRERMQVGDVAIAIQFQELNQETIQSVLLGALETLVYLYFILGTNKSHHICFQTIAYGHLMLIKLSIAYDPGQYSDVCG